MKANQIISAWWSRVNEHWLGQTSDARRHRRVLGRTGMGIGRGVFLFGLCLVLLYPILIMLSISMRTGAEMYDPTVIWIPKHITMRNFATIWTELDIARSLMMSAIASIVSTVLQLAACIITGYGFARFDFPGKKVLFGILLLMIIVPPQVVTIPSMMDFQRFDFFGIGQLVGLFTGDPLTVSLRDNLIAYFLPALFGNGIKSGLFIFIFIQFFRGLPHELQDAAYIDGCGKFRTFAVIMVPLAGAAILTVTLFSLVWYWNDSYFCVIHFDGLQTVSSFLQNINEAVVSVSGGMQQIDRVPLTYAAAVLTILPLLVIYIFLQRYFTESIERTGIVG